LVFWDRLLIKNGNYISQKREEFITFVNSTDSLNKENFSLEYDRSVISEARFEQYAREEVAAATTLVGPHRDDFIFFVDEDEGQRKRELSKYGSRGEQRMAVLWLKLAELAFIENVTKEKPALLLDDIFSELDHEHREIVMRVTQGQQTIITTADVHTIEEFKEMEKIELNK
jgi:DNA replication and repair protein RecF